MVYRRAANPVEVQLPPEATPSEISFASGLVALHGYELRAWSDPETDYLEVTLFWQPGQAPVQRDLLARVNLRTAAGETAFQVLDYPGETLFPTASWTPGMWLVDRYQLKRPAADAGPYTVELTLFASDADLPLEAVFAGGRLAE
jgi:hypothetical protein